MVSNIARQDLFVNCNNTVAYYDERTQGYDQAVQLRAFDENVLTAGGRKKRKGSMKYVVDAQEDGCTVSKHNAYIETYYRYLLQ